MTDAREWLIRKNGYFYRPNKSGYTLEKAAAGRYTKADADREAAIEPHNFKVMHESEVEDAPQVVDQSAEITTLRKELAEARALLTVIGKTFAGMEDGDGNEAPELVLIREFTAKTMADILAKQAAHPVLRPPSKAKGEKK